MIRKFILALIITGLSGGCFAGEHTWNFIGENSTLNSGGNGNVYQVSSGLGMKLDVSAWSSTGNGCSTVTGNRGIDDVDSCIQTAKLKQWDTGLGVKNRDERGNTPNHAIDNTNDKGRGKRNRNSDLDFDMVLLSFEEHVQLNNFGIGYEYKDLDASVLAFRGNTDFSTFGPYTKWSDLLTQGWDLINEKDGNTATGQAFNRDFAVNDQNIYAKHWLVGTFNSAFSNTHWTDSNDGFKINKLRVASKNHDDGTKVSAPATASILFLMLSLLAYRRKKEGR
jgi:hypothetical protein